MMNFSHLYIRRPIMTLLLTVAILIFGWIAYLNLPVAELPTVDFPVITVTAGLPGASPETMAVTVASPLERQFATIPGLETMNSSSGIGTTQITLVFALDRNIDAAAQDVQAAIAAAARFLPPNLPRPPVYRKVNPADLPILYIGMSSNTLPLTTVNGYAENILSRRISTIPGVAQVSVYGSQKFAVRVQVDPDKLATKGISLNDIEKAIQDNNVLLPTGIIETDLQAFTIEVKGQLEDAAAYRPLVIAYRNESPVRLQDVATIIDSVEDVRVASWVDNKRAIVLAVQRQPGSNTVEIANRVREILPEFKKILPAGIELKILYDRSVLIQESIHDVKYTLFAAMCLVILVIFIFLRNLSATFIASMALPVSIIGTFACMYFLNYSLDNLSLLALVLSIGFVVDDAIVMLENIVRHQELGESPIKAAFKGSSEITFTIISMTLSLVAVFIPVLFMGGLVGRLLNEFAVTICLAILISGFTSLSLTPMLCSRLLRGRAEGVATDETSSKKRIMYGKILKKSEKTVDTLHQWYESTLTWSLAHSFIILMIFFATVLLAILLYLFIPKGFLPADDLNQIIAFTEGDRDFSFKNMAIHQEQVVKQLAKNSNVESILSIVGIGGTRVSSNSGFIFLRLKPKSMRSETPDEIIPDMRDSIKNISGIKVFLQNPPSIRIGGQLTKAQYQYTLQDTDLSVLYRWAEIYKNKFKALPGFIDVTSDLDIDAPNFILNVNRDKAATLGVSMSDIQNTLGSAFGTKQISNIYSAENQYLVILEAEEDFEKNIENLSRLYVDTAANTVVPLGELVTIEQGVQSLSVNHLGQLPSATISFNLAPNKALGDALDEIQDLEAALKPPPSLLTSFQGTAQTFQKSMKGLNYLLIVAILTIYIVLGILYESFIHPLTILSGIPSAGVGALLTLLLFGIDLNLYAFTGIIMLIGIVKKNAIMMIDFAVENQRAKQMDPKKAIYSACLIRFRPIMMTTLAALVGTLPIALGLGAGGMVRQPLGLAVVGGLLVSQLLTLYITPVIYLYLERTNEYLNRKFALVADSQEG